MDPRLFRIRHVALDLDGTLYCGATLFPWSRPFLDTLSGLSIGFTFLTNNSSLSVAEYAEKLRAFGLPASLENIRTSALATLEYLRERHPAAKRVFLLGTPGLAREFSAHGYEIVDEAPDLVVAGFDTTLTHEKLSRAAWWIAKGRPFIATHPDRVCPTDRPTRLVDCGAICACLEAATGVAPEAVPGKPEPRMLLGILARHGLEPGELAVAGDRLSTDMAMARRAGALGVLVLSGEATAAEAARQDHQPPDLVVPTLAEFGALLKEA